MNDEIISSNRRGEYRPEAINSQAVQNEKLLDSLTFLASGSPPSRIADAVRVFASQVSHTSAVSSTFESKDIISSTQGVLIWTGIMRIGMLPNAPNV